MKCLVLVLVSLLSSGAAFAKDVSVHIGPPAGTVIADKVKFLYIGGCNGSDEFAGYVTKEYTIIVAEVGYGNDSSSARPYPVKKALAQKICEDLENRDYYRLAIENMGMFTGGVIIDAEPNNVIHLK